MTLKQLRESKGLSQTQAAKLAGVRSSTVSKIENGGWSGERSDSEHKIRRALFAYSKEAALADPFAGLEGTQVTQPGGIDK